MNRLLIVIFLFIAGGSVQAQKKSTKTPDPQKYAATITTDDLSRHLYIIAGKEMQGRETATEGQRKAAAYIEEQFKALGLQPGNGNSYQQAFPVYKQEMTSTEFQLNGTALQMQTDFIPFTLWNTSATSYFSELVFVGHGIVDKDVDDYKGLQVAGKAVLIMDGAPSGFKPSQSGFRSSANVYGKIMAARSKGAAAVVIQANALSRRMMNSGSTLFTELYKPDQYPNTYIVTEKVAKSIAGDQRWTAWKDAGKTAPVQGEVVKADVKLSYAASVSVLSSTNVLGVIEGTDKKDEWLIVTAHYDHEGVKDGAIYYGADDDGSGTVSVIEMAEAFAKAKAEGKGPRRSVLFMTVSGEEKGLWGSEFYSDHPTVALEKVTANLNIDMIGRIDTERMSADTQNYVYVVGDDKLSSDLKPLSEAMNSKYTKLMLDYKFNDPKDPNRIYFRSDHYNFARKGIPIIFYYDGMLKADYHQPTDTPDKINYPLLAKRAQLVFHTAWEMANRDAMMKRDIPLAQ